MRQIRPGVWFDEATNPRPREGDAPIAREIRTQLRPAIVGQKTFELTLELDPEWLAAQPSLDAVVINGRRYLPAEPKRNTD